LTEGPVVCNAGPLIALAGVAQLTLLRALYPRILSFAEKLHLVDAAHIRHAPPRPRGRAT